MAEHEADRPRRMPRWMTRLGYDALLVMLLVVLYLIAFHGRLVP